MVKLTMLLIYIVAGVFFMRWARTNTQRMVLFAISVLSFFYIVTVAVTKQAFGILQQI